MNVREKEYTLTHTLTAGECGPEGVMPLPLLVSRIIEVATYHANELGVGYARLVTDGLAWVLSRVSVEMNRWPRINERYSLTTWINDINRHFSERFIEVTSADTGEVLGAARSIWMAIDIKGRRGADLSLLESLRDVVSDRECHVERMNRFTPMPDTADRHRAHYTFAYCDCDFNRHVNTVRYIELLLNQWPLDFHDANTVERLDIAFMREAHYGDTVDVDIHAEEEPGVYSCAITRDGTELTRARLRYITRKS